MFKVQTLNKIAPAGLELLPREKYEVASEIANPDAIILRSFNMHEMELPLSLKAVARAGAGVNNIPVDKCSERGIVVFNTPGANANAVKELVLLGLLLCSRKVIDGIIWAKSLIGKGAEVPKLIEKGKSQFAGNEIKGKKLGIIGLGAIGVMVANDACALGMEVTGFDPFISVDSAWGLSRNVKRANGLESLITESDYISIHVPLTDQTKGMINRDKFALMKKGVHLLNFSRGGLVNNEDLKDAIEKNIVATYVTDFPDEEVLKMKNVIGIPHLGASTKEAEENCAIMAVNQLREFLEKGNIKNSVNLPDCEMPFSTSTRLLIINRNIPKMVGQITGVLAEKKINIANMLNKHKGDYAYNIIDIDGEITEQDVEKIRDIEGVIMVRVLLKE
ncbi:3-phosphoglycerate dehydrogenase [candidate division KSB1 bacterium]|nr:MAG: 3-phosphoglycerate dehydrogenase [candidate division KSB1 bacterium]RKY78928.1 MAG: 3-phosphoglycerate dehydrogenase [candidate division KSB1 bacterium]HDI51296.1 3-phosphoglycerate dehydrogenase [Bacteroidota bacterium]